VVERGIVLFPQGLYPAGQTALLAQGQVDAGGAQGLQDESFARDPGIAQLAPVQDLVVTGLAGAYEPHGAAFGNIQLGRIKIDVNQFRGTPVNDKLVFIAGAGMVSFGQSVLFSDFGHAIHQGLWELFGCWGKFSRAIGQGKGGGEMKGRMHTSEFFCFRLTFVHPVVDHLLPYWLVLRVAKYRKYAW
jgi:hypothetical protein